MRKKIISRVIIGIMTIIGASGWGLMQPAMALGGICETGAKAGQWVDDTSGCTPDEKKVDRIVGKAINLLLGMIGLLAILMIIWSGFRFTTSNGDPGKVKQAKMALVYSIVGLVVALLAFAIVNFVLKGLFK